MAFYPFATWAEKAEQEPTGNIRRAMMHGDLVRLSDLFKDTGNPAAAWLCWHLAQKWQMPAPQPVADEINRFAEKIGTLAIKALDGDPETVISTEVVAPFWDTSPKRAKDGSRRGSTSIAEQLLLWERDSALALRVYELRKDGLTKDAAVEKAREETGISFDNADRIAKKYRKDFVAEEAETKEEAAAWIREDEDR